MDEQEHKQRHIELHRAFDELIADFIQHTSGRLSNTILELVKWSHQQTITPSVKGDRVEVTDEG